jgi:hypothetical protein
MSDETQAEWNERARVRANKRAAKNAELARLREVNRVLLEAARFTVELLDRLTTRRFSIGEDKPARARLRAAIKAAESEDA